MKIPFVKMHGSGNDFVIIYDKYISLISKKTKKIAICDRNLGIGCDQLITIKPNNYQNYQIKFYNRDGSVGENCGNGLRCAHRYLTKFKKIKNPKIISDSGIHFGKNINEDVLINIGEVKSEWKDIPLIKKTNTQNLVLKGIKFKGLIKMMSANIGNPHCVVLVEKLNGFDFSIIGPKIENHVFFPKKANVTFVEILNKKKIKVLFWERGGGHTLACGSGTCATAFVLYQNGYTQSKISILTEISKLQTEIRNNEVFLRGPAKFVFEGHYLI